MRPTAPATAAEGIFKIDDDIRFVGPYNPKYRHDTDVTRRTECQTNSFLAAQHYTNPDSVLFIELNAVLAPSFSPVNRSPTEED